MIIERSSKRRAHYAPVAVISGVVPTRQEGRRGLAPAAAPPMVAALACQELFSMSSSPPWPGRPRLTAGRCIGVWCGLCAGWL